MWSTNKSPFDDSGQSTNPKLTCFYLCPCLWEMCFCGTFTCHGKVSGPEAAQDVVQEEALLRQWSAQEALASQSVIQHAAQNCTHFLFLVRRWRVYLGHDVAGRHAALVHMEMRGRRTGNDQWWLLKATQCKMIVSISFLWFCRLETLLLTEHTLPAWQRTMW